MKEFQTPEYSGVWLPFLADRQAFRSSVQNYLREKLNEHQGTLFVDDTGPHWQKDPLTLAPVDVVQISYAHTPGAAVLVFSRTHRLGIDVESLDREMKSDPLKIAERFYHPSEVAELTKYPKNELKNALLRLWVKKEAYAKLTRLGLSKTVANRLPSQIVHNAKTLPVAPEGFLSCILFEKI
jgi:hypothetical protein